VSQRHSVSPDCFSAADRASAQTILDTIDQGVQKDALDDLSQRR
jgi:hypothetical protein